MDATMILGCVIVGPLVLSAAALLGCSEEWLRAFALLARSLGRSL